MSAVLRGGFTAALLVIFAAGPVFANSCSNVNVLGTYDQSGLKEGNWGIYAAGTFRIEGESDESKQPMFNLSTISCENKVDDTGKEGFECQVTEADVLADAEKPNTENPNCSLDLNVWKYSMKELQRNVLTGIDPFATSCFKSILTIDRNRKRVYRSYIRTEYADNYDNIRPRTCGASPPTQVLMNCTAWPRIRHGDQQAPSRYCDFSEGK